MLDMRDMRQGLFARLSARIGLSGPSATSGSQHGSQQGSHTSLGHAAPGSHHGWQSTHLKQQHSKQQQQRGSDGGKGGGDNHTSGSGVVAGAPQQPSPPAVQESGRQRQHRQPAQQQPAQQQPSRLGQGGSRAGAATLASAHAGALQPQGEAAPLLASAGSPMQQQQQQQQLPHAPAALALQRSPTGVPRAALDGEASPFARAPQLTPADSTSPRARAPLLLAGAGDSVSPRASALNRRSAPPDAPMNLDAIVTGGTVVGAGTRAGVGVVDSGLALLAAAAAAGQPLGRQGGRRRQRAAAAAAATGSSSSSSGCCRQSRR
jgi:hypothetical protein